MEKEQVLLIVDDNPVARSIREMVGRGFQVRQVNINALGGVRFASTPVAVVCLHHNSLKIYNALRRELGIADASTVIVLPTYNAASEQRLKDSGITDFLTAPVPPPLLWARIKKALNAAAEAAWDTLPGMQKKALQESRRSLAASFDAARKGYPLDRSDIETTCEYITTAATQVDLMSWLSTIRGHHDYTYRHSMMVSGTLVNFGKSMGIRGEDLQFLAVGGTLHDVGKSMVPLEILDKPAKLEDREVLEMRKHPDYSREILLRESGLDPRIIAMAVQHHEKLDGTGYPDGLKGSELSDLVRLVCIADVFSALVDERSYKPAMTVEAAFDKMLTFKGHLDLELVAAYRTFVMDNMAAQRRLQPLAEPRAASA